MTRSPRNRSSRRAFLFSCSAPLLLPQQAYRGTAAQGATTTWEQAVDAYLSGDADVAARVLQLPRDVMRSQARQVIDSVRTSPDSERPTVRRLQGSTMLALEVLLAYSGIGALDDSLRLLEPIALDSLGALLRFEKGASRRREPGGIPAVVAGFRARGYVAVLQVLVNQQRRRDVTFLAPRIKVPADDRPALAELRFLRGLLEESIVRFNVPTGPDGPRETAPPSLDLSVGKRYDRAQNWFRQALDAKNDHAEARLHLGRLELENRQHPQALETLGPLDGNGIDATTRGLARLFMGECYAGDDAVDAARQAFSRAAEIGEVRQSALVALTLLALRAGDHVEASDATRALDVTGAAVVDTADAWTGYVSGRRTTGDAVVRLMREALVR